MDGLVIISDTTMFLFKRLMKDEEELRNLERSLELAKIHEEHSRLLWLALDTAGFASAAKEAHHAYTARQWDTKRYEGYVDAARRRVLRNVAAQTRGD